MSDAPLILGVSGLRGIVGESLTPEVAVRYAGAVGAWFAAQDPYVDTTEIIVGHDGRAGHDVVYHAVIAGLLANGWSVIPIGRATTPTIGFAVGSFDRDSYYQPAGGVVITASHNPQEWNGIKVLTRLAVGENSVWGVSAPSAADAAEIVRRYETSDLTWPDDPMGYGKKSRCAEVTDLSIDFADQHAKMVHERAIGMCVANRKQLSLLRIVVDSVNASGSYATACLFRWLEIDHVQLCGSDNGIFPHTPEPTKENLSGEGGLCDAVPGLKADVGFAQDPDADRLAIVDELGNYIGEEYTLVLCAAALMEGRKAKDGGQDAHRSGDGKPVFVVNLSTSRMIDDVAAHYGAEVERTAVGEANVVERMKALTAAGRDVVMGGEGNGGVIWAEVTYVRDSLSAMALTLSLMARTGKTVSELVKMIEGMGPGKAGYSIIKKKAALASKADAVPVVEHLAEVFGGDPEARVDTQDGVRVDWDAKGVWAHVRASNTEPIMRVIVEAPTGEIAEATAAMVEVRIAEVRG